MFSTRHLRRAKSSPPLLTKKKFLNQKKIFKQIFFSQWNSAELQKKRKKFISGRPVVWPGFWRTQLVVESDGSESQRFKTWISQAVR